MIDMKKKYRTKSGHHVRIVCTDVDNEYPVVALVRFNNRENGEYEQVCCYPNDGKLLPNPTCDMDLVECKPWEELKRGDACLVRDNLKQKWEARVFSGVNTSNGKPMVFSSSFSVFWNYCIPFNEYKLGTNDD